MKWISILPLLTLATLGALSEAPLAAQESPPTATESAEPAKEQKICKRIVVTGSRLAARKVCATKLEWDEHHRAALELGGVLTERPRHSPGEKPQ